MWKRVVCVVWTLLYLSTTLALPLSENDLSGHQTTDRQDPGQYLNSFLVEVDDHQIAERVARDNGFVLVEKIPELDMYLLNHPEVTQRSRRSADDYVTKLKSDSRVRFVEQQITLRRVKRTHAISHDKQFEFPIRQVSDNSKFFRNPDKFDARDSLNAYYNDKYYQDQWYLRNEGQTGGSPDIDLNVLPAWEQGYTGRGVRVTTLDDGVDHSHPDIRNNYDPEASADMNDRTDTENDPTPDKSDNSNSHGTRCAGEIAAEAGNGICGVGVAHEARIGGIRILDGRVTDELEARALLYKSDYIDIYSASWGPHDNGRTMEAPGRAATEALRRGVKNGRGGKGCIYVWATGNGGMADDMCGADGYVSSPESISVQSLTDRGDIPFFGERCTSTMVAVPTGGEHTREEEIEGQYKIKVVTTDINGGCIENFEGTSSAAPLASGCYALVLQANPRLTWRDVQHVTVEGARISYDDSAWTVNGAGYHVNDKFGFGMMDCARMVELAQTWVNKPEQHVCETNVTEVNAEIRSSQCHKTTFQFDGCQGDSEREITHLEHVQLTVKAASERRGNVEIFLESPAGTRSKLLLRRSNDDSSEDINFTFMTVHSWMENPVGQWTVEVCDNPGDGGDSARNTVHFQSYSMRAYGFYDDSKTSPRGKATNPDSKEVKKIMDHEYRASRAVVLKRAQTGDTQNNDVDVKKEWDKFSGKASSIFQSISHIFGSRSFDRSQLLEDKNKYDDRGFNNVASNQNRKSNSDIQEEDKRIEELKDEIVTILLEMNDPEVNNYLERYLERKREMEREKSINDLVKKIEKLLTEKK